MRQHPPSASVAPHIDTPRIDTAGIDTEQLRRSVSLQAVIAARLKLTRQGTEWIGLCPFHQEKTPSFTVNEAKGFYHCFGCGAHGDVIRFIQDFHRLDFRAACAFLGADMTGSAQPPTAPRVPAKTADPTADPYADLVAATPDHPVIVPHQPLRCWNPKRPERPWTVYRPSLVFPYHTGDGTLLGYVLRVDLAARGDRAARKITPTIRYAILPDGSTGWCHWSFDKPRLLYRLPDLLTRPADQVLIVEGEKAAEAARRLLAGLPFAVTTWPGGAKAMRHVDWSPLQGRDVVLWGDADVPGEQAMLGHAGPDGSLQDGVAQLCQAAGAKRIRILPWDRQRLAGWDAADAEADGWSPADLLAWLMQRTQGWPVAAHAATPAPPMPPAPSNQPPFRVLGFNHGSYFYLPRASRQVVALTAAAHTRPHLLTLAPLSYWAGQYPGRNGFDLEAATDALISAAHAAGLFTPERLRGRGAWRDGGRLVMHLGRHLLVDGEVHDPAAFAGDHVYEVAPDLGGTLKAGALSSAANTVEANRLVQVCRRLTWENELSADLLAGWCVIALLCGVLAWRPHLWITGPAQAGKSTVIRDIIQRVVGVFALYVDGKTTEAGIRQLLGTDARPVILDEVESEDPVAAARVQQILDMARVSSSGGTVVKGSTAGRPQRYTLRACFCFSSINTAIAHYADETRISKLVLRRNEAPDADRHYHDLLRDIDAWFTPDYAQRMLARSLQHLDLLIANIESFRQAAARVLGSRRAADQIGTMLAGLHLCHSTAAVSVAEAADWIKARDWHDHTALDAAGDEMRLLECLATRRLRMPVAGGQREVTVGQAIMAVHGQPESHADWAAELGAHGIRIESDDILIANQASPLKRLLEGTPWASDWLRPLRLLPGASAAPNTYFSPGLKSRATRLPVKLLQGDG